jgi:hypothetical protein
MKNAYKGKIMFATLVPIFALLLLAGMYFTEVGSDTPALSSDDGAPIEDSIAVAETAEEAPIEVPPKESAGEGAPIEEIISSAVLPGSSSSSSPAASGAAKEENEKNVLVEDVSPFADVLPIKSEPFEPAAKMVCTIQAASTGAANSMAECIVVDAAGKEAESEEFGADSLEPSLYGSCYQCAPNGMCDANEDGTVDQGDVTRVLEYLSIPGTTCGYCAYSCYCDVFNDERADTVNPVNSYDATVIARCVEQKGPIGPINTCQDCVGYGMCDANGDGTISGDDADAIRMYILGNTSTCGYMNETGYCDLNGENNIDVADALMLEICLNKKGEIHPIQSCEECVGYGMCDANGDGDITTDDVMAMRLYAIGNSTTCGYMGEAGYCDLNGANNVTNADAIILARCLMQDVCDPDQELISNGGFEAPLVTNPAGWDIFYNGTGGLEWNVEWMATPESKGINVASLELQRNATGPSAEGDQYAELDGDLYGPGDSLEGVGGASVKISQMISTIPGEKYNLTFAFSPRAGTNASNNVLEARVNGEVLGTISQDGLGNQGTDWTYHSYQFTAEGTSALVEFSDLGTQDSLGTLLDDVSLRCEAGANGNGTLIVRKFVSGSDVLPSEFNITVNDEEAGEGFTFPGSEQGEVLSLAPGQYEITETYKEDFEASYAGDCGAEPVDALSYIHSVYIEPGGVYECNITNTYTGQFVNDSATLRVVKVVVGGSLGVSDFQLFVNGSQVYSGSEYTMPVGTYIVSETGASNYVASFSESCPQGVITLIPGAMNNCTITNTYVAPPSPPGPSGPTGGNNNGGGNTYIAPPQQPVEAAAPGASTQTPQPGTETQSEGTNNLAPPATFTGMNRSAIPTPILFGGNETGNGGSPPLAASLFGLDLGSFPWLPVLVALLLAFFIALALFLLAKRGKKQQK